MTKTSLPVLLAAMDDVDKRRLVTTPVGGGATPLAQTLTRIYADQGITVDQDLIRTVAEHHSGEHADTFVDLFSSATWKTLAPELAASVLLEETDQYDTTGAVDIDRILRNVFGAGHHRSLDNAEGRQAGMMTGNGVHLVTWKPLTPGYASLSAYFSILEELRTKPYQSYVLALMLWQMMQNGWNQSYPGPKPLRAARHLNQFGAHLRGVDEKAEAFAMALLLPEARVRAHLDRTTGQLWWRKTRHRTADELAKLLHVPASMMALRLTQLGITPAAARA